jgi:hypothetical protein
MKTLSRLVLLSAFAISFATCKKTGGGNPPPPTSLPTIASSSPVSGSAGISVTISGANFDPAAANAKYWKNGTAVVLGSGNNNAFANSIYVSGTDVYVAGTDNFTTGGATTSVSNYWKNGVGVALADGGAKTPANSIFASGNDVYVAGDYFVTGQIYAAKYWKNGTATALTDGTFNAGARSIFVK